MATTVTTEELWFLNTLVTVRIPHEMGSDGISLLESLAPHGDSPPLHVHETEDELFHILSGSLRFRVGDRELELNAGQSLLAPKGVPHTYRVESDTGRWLVVASQGDFERLVRSFSRPALRSALPDPAAPPSPEEAEALAAACRAHSIEVVGPPMR